MIELRGCGLFGLESSQALKPWTLQAAHWGSRCPGGMSRPSHTQAIFWQVSRQRFGAIFRLRLGGVVMLSLFALGGPIGS